MRGANRGEATPVPDYNNVHFMLLCVGCAVGNTLVRKCHVSAGNMSVEVLKNDEV